jgi:hypothetical protein
MMVNLMVPSMQLATYAGGVPYERLIFFRMQGPRLLDGSFLALSPPLPLRQIFGPRESQHLKMVGVYSVKVFLKNLVRSFNERFCAARAVPF